MVGGHGRVSRLAVRGPLCGPGMRPKDAAHCLLPAPRTGALRVERLVKGGSEAPALAPVAPAVSPWVATAVGRSLAGCVGIGGRERECYSAWILDADRRANSLSPYNSGGSKLSA